MYVILRKDQETLSGIIFPADVPLVAIRKYSSRRFLTIYHPDNPDMMTTVPVSKTHGIIETNSIKKHFKLWIQIEEIYVDDKGEEIHFRDLCNIGHEDPLECGTFPENEKDLALATMKTIQEQFNIDYREKI